MKPAGVAAKTRAPVDVVNPLLRHYLDEANSGIFASLHARESACRAAE